MSGNFSGGSFSGAIGGFSVDAISSGGGLHQRHIRNLGNLSQSRVEEPTDKLARRIREGTIQAPVTIAPPEAKRNEYADKSARMAAGIAKFRAEVTQHRQAIERIETAQIKRQTKKLQRDLLRAQQALQLATVREAVLLEELEVIDIAFIAQAVIGMVMQ